MSKPVPDRLRDAAELFESRNKVYGQSYKDAGFTFASIFPSGLTITDVSDWNRACLFIQIVNKTLRYANNFSKGGHADSLDDIAVYAMMLRELDDDKEERDDNGDL